MKNLLGLIAISIAVHCSAQSPETAAPEKTGKPAGVIFFDDFDNNKNKWTIGSNGGATGRIDSGFYYLTSSGSAYGEAQEIRINTRKDFQIEARIRIVSGNPLHKHYYSMLFWGREAMDGYNFTFAGDGFASVETCHAKRQASCTVSEGSFQKTALDPAGFNVYKIRKVGDLYTFYINDTEFYKTPFAPFFGNLVGFGAGRKVSLAIDYLKVSYL
ncbi:MAG: hypothetical protein EOP50_01220 [Sphingobacteriales bacterium]|nr:MAG: hypothetical protein EOP50_01220 [Sphingobacteriales bacterium]